MSQPAKSNVPTGPAGTAPMSVISDPGLPSRAWLVVILLWVVAAFNYLDRLAITSMHESLLAAIPMSETQFGLVTSLFLWVYAALSPVAGFLADRFSRKWVIIGSLAAWSAATLATAYVKTYPELLATRVLLGVSQAAYLPAGLALISDYHRGPTRSLATGVHMTGIMAGTILAGAAGWLADRSGWASAFLVFGIAGLAYCGLLAAGLRDSPIDSAGNVFGSTKAPKARFGAALLSLFSCGSFFLALGFWGLRGIAGWAMRGWMPTYLQEHFHLSQGASGFTANGYPMLVALAGVLIGGAWADRWTRTNPRGRVLVPVIGLCVAAPAVLLSVSTNVLGVVILAMILLGLAGSFGESNMMPILCSVVDPRYRATGYGILNAFACVIGGVTIYAGGVLRDAHVDLSRVFQFAAGSLVVCAVFLFSIKVRAANR